MLLPLMKEQYQTGASDMKQQLLDVVVARDNIGEALWYVYTAILLISITQYNIMSKPCKKDLASMQQGQDEYIKTKKQIDSESKKANSKIYTL
jgi:hypothetical protein